MIHSQEERRRLQDFLLVAYCLKWLKHYPPAIPFRNSPISQCDAHERDQEIESCPEVAVSCSAINIPVTFSPPFNFLALKIPNSKNGMSFTRRTLQESTLMVKLYYKYIRISPKVANSPSAFQHHRQTPE